MRKKDYASLPVDLKKKVKKQFRFLTQDLRHPSINAKKYPEGGDGVWQGRVDRSYRFYFTIEGDVYLVQAITPHPK